MTHMLDDPATMTPSQRRCEIAAILARGVLRLRQCRENLPSSDQSCTAKETSESRQNCLEEGSKSSPYVLTG